MQRFLFCSYKKSSKINFRQSSTTVRSFLPFSFDENEAVDRFNRWRNSLWLAPNDWKNLKVTANRHFIPCWSFSMKGSVTAEAYIQRGSWLTGGIEWEKFSERVQLNDVEIDDVNIYAAYLYDRENIIDLKLELGKNLIENEESKFNEEIIDEWTIDRATAFEIAWDTTVINKVQELCVKELKKKRRAEFKISSVRFPIEKEIQRLIYFPIYTIEHSFGERNFQYLINGRNGRVAGQRQFSRFKVSATLLGFVYPICLSSSVSVLSLAYYMFTQRIFVIPTAIFLTGFSLPFCTIVSLQIGKYFRDYSHLYRGKRDIREWLDFKKRNPYLFNDRASDKKNSSSTFEHQRTGKTRDPSFTFNIGPDLYKILAISRIASDAEIKRAYLAKVKEFHPDRNPGRTDIEETFKMINQAYTILSNREQREIYDQYGYENVKHQ